MLHTIRRNAASVATSVETVGRGALNPNNIKKVILSRLQMVFNCHGYMRG